MKQGSNHPMLLAGVVMLVIVPFVFTARIHAQENWKRMEVGGKEMSFALPPGFLVKKDTMPGSRVTSLLGYQDRTAITVALSDLTDAKANLGRIAVEETRKPIVLEFEFDGVPGKSVVYTDRGYEYGLYLAAKKGYYVIQIASESKDNPAVSRFLRSIRLKGKALVEGAAGPLEAEDAPIAVNSLDVSSDVDEALNRKGRKSKVQITYRPSADFRPCAYDFGARPALLVTRISPDLPRPDLFPKMSGKLIMNVQLLANGEVGDIVVYSDMERLVLRAFAEAAAKLRFVPAQKAGMPASYCETIPMRFGTTQQRIMISVAN